MAKFQLEIVVHLLVTFLIAAASSIRLKRAIVKKYEKSPNSIIAYEFASNIRHFTSSVTNPACLLDPSHHPHALAAVNSSTRQCVLDAMSHVSAASCVSFVRRPTDQKRAKQPYVLVERHDNERTCNAYTGIRSFGPTVVRLGDHCGGILQVCLHELMHALGFEHEHERPTRNEYVTINFDNLRPGAELGYTKTITEDDYDFMTPYDLSSIMHYGAADFADKPHTITMETRDHPIMERSLGSHLRGRRHPLSHRDKLALNRLFQCDANCLVKRQCAHGGYVDDTCRCQCPYGFDGDLCEQLKQAKFFSAPTCGVVQARPEDGWRSLTSPNYPGPYKHAAFCQWLVKAADPAHVIQFKFDTIDLEHENVDPAERCADTLQVWPHGTDVITKYLSCMPSDVDRYRRYTYKTQYNWLMVEFRSAVVPQGEHRGFNISYRVVDPRPPPPETTPAPAVLRSRSEYMERLRNTRVKCYACDGLHGCDKSLENMTQLLCPESHACGVTRVPLQNSETTSDGVTRKVVTWRGCMQMDKCEHMQQCGGAPSQQIACTKCCAHDSCNGAVRKREKLVVSMLMATLVFRHLWHGA